MSAPPDDDPKMFDKRHKNAWLVVTGGMIALGTVNVALGYLFWPSTPKEDFSVPIPTVTDRAAATVEPTAAVLPDAGVTPDAP